MGIYKHDVAFCDVLFYVFDYYRKHGALGVEFGLIFLLMGCWMPCNFGWGMR